MFKRAKTTMPRSKKGPVVPPPAFRIMNAVAEQIFTMAESHCDRALDISQAASDDGIDSYVGDEELGHLLPQQL